MQNNNAQVEKLKRKADAIDKGVEISLLGEVLEITIRMSKATFKGKSYFSLSAHEKQDFEDLLYLSNVTKGNPIFIYTV